MLTSSKGRLFAASVLVVLVILIGVAALIRGSPGGSGFDPRLDRMARRALALPNPCSLPVSTDMRRLAGTSAERIGPSVDVVSQRCTWSVGGQAKSQIYVTAELEIGGPFFSRHEAQPVEVSGADRAVLLADSLYHDGTGQSLVIESGNRLWIVETATRRPIDRSLLLATANRIVKEFP